MNETRSKYSLTFYGNMIVLLSLLALFASLGIRGSFGVYVLPWEESFSTNRVGVSTVSFISLVVYGIGMVVAGKMTDKYGSRLVLVGSMLFMAISLIIAYFAQSIWHMAFLYGIITSLGFGGASYVTVSVAILKWFHKRQGFMISLVTLGMAVGPMLFIPLSIFIIQVYDWRLTFLLYGTIFLVIFVPLFWFFYKDKPEDLGLKAWGSREMEVKQGLAESAASVDRDKISHKVSIAPRKVKSLGILSYSVTWLIVIPYFLSGFTNLGLIQTHFVPFMELKGFTDGTIASTMVFYGVINIVGTVIVGFLTDKISVIKILIFLFSMRIAGLIVLFFTHDPVLLFVFALLYAGTDISSITPFTKLCATIYGVEGMGSSFGIITFFHQFGAAVGSFILSILFSISFNYQSSLIVSALLLVVASIFLLFINERKYFK